MQSKRKLLVTLLAVVTVVALAACSATPSATTVPTVAPTATPTAAPITAATATASTGEDDKYLGAYPETVTITTVGQTSSSEKFFPGEDRTNNVMTKLILDKLNIKIQYLWLVDGTQWSSKVATMLASNAMPDYFYADPTTFVNLETQDAVMDITQVYKEYEGPWLAEMMNRDPVGMQTAYLNGKMYGIPFLGNGTGVTSQLMWIRRQWLNQANLQVPQTTDELTSVALALMSQNAGSYGIALDGNLYNSYASIIPVCNAFHAYPQIWIKKDGQLAYGSIQPEMKAALQYLQDWYKQGIISKEFSAKTSDTVVQDLVSGKVGMVFGQNWLGFSPLNQCMASDQNEDWWMFVPPSSDSTPISLSDYWQVSGYWVVNKNCQHPEAILKMLNLWHWLTNYLHASDENMKIWNDWTQTMKWTDFPIYTSEPGRDYESAKAISKALQTGDTSGMVYDFKLWYDYCKSYVDKTDLNQYNFYSQRGPADSALMLLSNMADSGRIVMTGEHGPDPAGYAKIRSTLDTLELQTFTKIIMGQDVSTFDSFVDSWKKLGGDEATAEINSTYNK